MAQHKSAQTANEARPAPILPADAHDLRPHYANGAVINHSPYEFTLTFVRSDHLFDSPSPGEGDPAAVGIATRVALSHRAMKEFLDVAIANYEQLRASVSDLPALKALEPDAE